MEIVKIGKNLANCYNSPMFFTFRYAQIDKEALALVFTVQSFIPVCMGQKIHVGN